jgi:hypothetical protein
VVFGWGKEHMMTERAGRVELKLFVHHAYEPDFVRTVARYQTDAIAPTVDVVKLKLAVTDPFSEGDSHEEPNGILYTLWLDPAILTLLLIDLTLGEAVQVTQLEAPDPITVSGLQLLNRYGQHFDRKKEQFVREIESLNRGYKEIFGEYLFETSQVDGGFLTLVRFSPNVKKFKEIMKRHCLHTHLPQTEFAGVGPLIFLTLQKAVKDLMV